MLDGIVARFKNKEKSEYVVEHISRYMLPVLIKLNTSIHFLRLVEHIGFEPMTSSMPWKRASQLCQCPKVYPHYSKYSPLSLGTNIVRCYAPTRGTVLFSAVFVLSNRA